MHGQDETWSHALVERLQALNAGLTPAVWDIKLNISEAPAAYNALIHDQRFTLCGILRNGTDRSQLLPSVVLLIARAGQIFLLPDGNFSLAAGDQLLLASSLEAKRNFEFTVRNANELDYVLSGREESGSWLWHRLCGEKPAKTTSTTL